MHEHPRVCPSCGEPAGRQPFCGLCGVNLTKYSSLPTRTEWEDKQPKSVRRIARTLEEAFNESKHVESQQREQAQRARRERRDSEESERRASAELVQQFLTVMRHSNEPGLTVFRKMCVLLPLRTRLLGIEPPVSATVPSGRKAGTVSGWIIRKYESGASTYETHVPATSGLLVGVDGHVYTLEPSIWGGPSNNTPTIHIHEDESNAGQRGYTPGVEDLPITIERLAHALASVLRANNLSP